MRGRWVAAGLAAVVVAGSTAAGTVVVARSGEALPGTTVAGQAVGGQDRTTLRRTVEALAQDRTTGVLAVTADGERAEVARSLVQVDVDATVERALDAGRAGLVPSVVGPLTGGGEDVALVATVDEAALDRALAAITATVDRPADDGGFAVQGVDVTARQPVAGRSVETAGAADALRTALLAGAPSADLPVAVTAPTTTPEDVAAVTAQATAALAGPYAVGTGTAVLRLEPQQVAPLLTAVPTEGALVLQVDPARLQAEVEREAERLEIGAREARFTVVTSAPAVTTKGDLTWTPKPAEVRVVPGSNGREVDVAATTTLLAQRIAAARREPAALPLTVVEPDLTTAGAQAAKVRTLVGTFTTSFAAGAPRATNIRRIAALVDGTYVAPGEVLSLNAAAGPRTRARGFVADGAIVDGELTDEVGGGVSQFATTLFNAAFFAGLPIPEHKPHSFYIGRYPAGRESTVYFGAIDVKVRNDTGNGLLVRTRSTPGSVTVELYGDNGGRRVTSTSGPRRPRADGGFRIAVTRTVRGGDGVSSRRVFTTSYDPVPPDRR